MVEKLTGVVRTLGAEGDEEVRTLGPLNGSTRTAEQTAIALFFANNPVPMYRNALCELLDAEPLGLLPTTRLFARIDAAVATTEIETWRLKYEVGFWRPFEAIAKGGDDGNGGTNVHEGPGPWVPLIANPAYSDYTSGHAGGTSPFAEVMRRTFGDDTPLVLKLGAVERNYATLSDLEEDPKHPRVLCRSRSHVSAAELPLAGDQAATWGLQAVRLT